MVYTFCVLVQELARDTDIRVVEGMVSPELLERVALSKGVTLRVQDTMIEVLGRTSATAEACAELETLLEHASVINAAAETQSVRSPSPAHTAQDAEKSPESPKVARDNVGTHGHMGNGHMANQNYGCQRVENRCPTCGCGRFCGNCGVQIWTPTYSASWQYPAYQFNTAMTSGFAAYAPASAPKDDSPTRTPDPAETNCGTMMFPMLQMGQAPVVLMPADSGREIKDRFKTGEKPSCHFSLKHRLVLHLFMSPFVAKLRKLENQFKEGLDVLCSIEFKDAER